jgi:hypothetical protein
VIASVDSALRLFLARRKVHRYGFLSLGQMHREQHGRVGKVDRIELYGVDVDGLTVAVQLHRLLGIRIGIEFAAWLDDSNGLRPWPCLSSVPGMIEAPTVYWS